ncbi:MAG: hypothetical protein QXF97_08540 [Candidatus Caldarchaeum sp.]
MSEVTMRKTAHSIDEALKFLKSFARERGLAISLPEGVVKTSTGYMYEHYAGGPPAHIKKPVYRWSIMLENSGDVSVEVEPIA